MGTGEEEHEWQLLMSSVDAFPPLPSWTTAHMEFRAAEQEEALETYASSFCKQLTPSAALSEPQRRYLWSQFQNHPHGTTDLQVVLRVPLRFS